MSLLYVTEQGARIGLSHGRLLVRVDGVTRLVALLHETERVLVFGAVEISSAAVSACLEAGLDIVYFSRDGRLKGRLVGDEAKNIERRLAQYRARDNPPRCLALARAFVGAKVRNCLALARRQAREHGELPLAGVIRRLRELRPRLAAAGDLDELRGLEGYAARVWFRGLRLMLRGELTFDRRARRPPPDPVNSLLSLGYSLVGAELAGALTGVGLDPGLGYLHAPAYSRLSLAQDLLEEFRAEAVDRLVLKVVNKRILRPEHFAPREEGGVGLTKTGWRAFLQQYESHLRREFVRAGRRIDLRRCFVIQARALAHDLEGGPAYEGFVTR